jgi:hypothetical protein
MISQYTRLTQAKQLLDADINSIKDSREDSVIVQCNFNERFSTKSDPQVPQNEPVGVVMRDPRKLFAIDLDKQDIVYSNLGIDVRCPRSEHILKKDFSTNF